MIQIEFKNISHLANRTNDEVIIIKTWISFTAGKFTCCVSQAFYLHPYNGYISRSPICKGEIADAVKKRIKCGLQYESIFIKLKKVKKVKEINVLSRSIIEVDGNNCTKTKNTIHVRYYKQYNGNIFIKLGDLVIDTEDKNEVLYHLSKTKYKEATHYAIFKINYGMGKIEKGRADICTFDDAPIKYQLDISTNQIIKI